MEWLSLLLLLLCPLMMIFCMKGHLGGHKHSHGNDSHQNHDSHLSNGVLSKVKNLELENEKLRKEINELTTLVKKQS